MGEFFIPGCFHSHKIAKSNFNDVKNPSGFIPPKKYSQIKIIYIAN